MRRDSPDSFARCIVILETSRFIGYTSDNVRFPFISFELRGLTSTVLASGHEGGWRDSLVRVLDEARAPVDGRKSRRSSKIRFAGFPEDPPVLRCFTRSYGTPEFYATRLYIVYQIILDARPGITCSFPPYFIVVRTRPRNYIPRYA